MKKTLYIMIALFISLSATRALAGPDQFIGDTAIYSGIATATLRPNILLLIDNSNVTLNAASGTKYDPAVDYCAVHGSCANNRYDILVAGQQGDFSVTISNSTAALENMTCHNNNDIVKNTLLSQGTYVGSGTADYPNLKQGACDTAPKGKTYALGNFMNYTQSSAGATGDTQRKVVYDAISTVVGGARYAVNFGAMVYGNNNSGGEVIYQIGDLSSDTNFNAFLSALPGPGNTDGAPVLSSQTARPQGESLLDAGYYFWGLGLPISHQAAMTSPITHSCDKNHVIIITNGISNKDDSPQLGTIVGDFDHDGAEASTYGLGTHYLDDVAKYLYEHPTSPGQRIQTDTILAFQADDELVERAANASHGRGQYFIVANANELADALTKLISNIVLEADTSFVAPVVPVSPENRTYSGNRVYMGFFKPINETCWNGNLKKYGINSHNFLTDKNGTLSSYTDFFTNLTLQPPADGRDDNDGAILPSGSENGSFRATATSFWSSSPDGGAVESGGGGEVLHGRDFTSSVLGTNPRQIFTYMGTNTNLTAASNRFSTANLNDPATNPTGDIYPSTLGLSTNAEAANLINFVHGVDVYDENGNANTTEKRAWIFGDILHSRPLIINYSTFAFTGSNESTCGNFNDPTETNTNKSIIFVGSNDGMLHAIKDCDGNEAWAFIPPDMLGNLNYLPQTTHTYFMDSTPSVYIYDSNNDGKINTTSGDKVILIFGERRGGGANSPPTSGTYYALDVSNPLAPTFMWSISNSKKVIGTTSTASTDYQELAETWSEPKLVKMKIGTAEKIVAFVGAGYDNIHEDTRFGNTRYFSNAASVISSDAGNGNVVSSGTTAATGLTNPKGRGVYAIEIATLTGGVPGFGSSGTKIWGYVYGATTNESAVPPASSTNSLMRYSIPSEISAIDANNDGYADRLYVADTGGKVWRFDVGDSTVTNWRGKRLFNLNSGSTDVISGTTINSVGKKFFYRPSVIMEKDYTMLFIGSGDREHPLNRDVNLIDRMYALKDLGQTTADDIDESYLYDVTADLIQTDSSAVAGILTNLNSHYGWYIKLDQSAGEKILASLTVFNKVAYFTTYAPNTTVSIDPCSPGNLGTARLYAVDYKTGASVLNYDIGNDTASGEVLVRSDRSVTLGSGIPSGIVIIIGAGGELKGLVNAGGLIIPMDPKKGGSIRPLYWRQK